MHLIFYSITQHLFVLLYLHCKQRLYEFTLLANCRNRDESIKAGLLEHRYHRPNNCRAHSDVLYSRYKLQHFIWWSQRAALTLWSRLTGSTGSTVLLWQESRCGALNTQEYVNNHVIDSNNDSLYWKQTKKINIMQISCLMLWLFLCFTLFFITYAQ